ncbi:RTA1 like protein-domain-containing protein [Neohortaea acidophila]|uniref:RTA1 like protein-domain-containing protein n=1 Tax=Neohortaea acidophila TaxID=245834 RepID=A0A6A6PZU9_9PEZI|nr:RTA1 like protein-domain-containing protein [Neohortaea acidophila]KAF2484963.1 RTA1 like protein-domain-containing protein [Neohortaea acidophila]
MSHSTAFVVSFSYHHYSVSINYSSEITPPSPHITMDAHHLFRRLNENGDCTQATCPVSDSIYGYRPNLAATLIFLILFAVSGIAYAVQGYLRPTTRFFTIVMVLGAISEVLGYVAKMLLWQNPFSNTGFKATIVLLTFAPAFYAAGIYYTLKHICLTFGASFSRLRPKWYTWIFISSDIFSILLQAVGGAVSSASPNLAVLSIGSDIMIAGLVTQVVTLVAFGILAADYALRVYRNRAHLNPATAALRTSLRFRLFLAALWIAYLGILVRCCYRVAELAGGWTGSNRILKEEGLFIGLDSVPVGIAAVVLNVWHPGWCFPREEEQREVNEKVEGEASDEEARV